MPSSWTRWTRWWPSRRRESQIKGIESIDELVFGDSHCLNVAEENPRLRELKEYEGEVDELGELLRRRRESQIKGIESF